ncbi:hypothetical protein GC174_09530 [bacterium]|nr:hypothetical protein [bacterium]
MLTSKTKFEEILNLAPEWRPVLERLDGSDSKASAPSLVGLFQELGAPAIYSKASSLDKEKGNFVSLVRDYYYQPLFQKMLRCNQNLKRFWAQRRVDRDSQEHNCISLSVELAHKMATALEKQLAEGNEDGFKVILPAYAQRSVYNAVVDYVRKEWQWEKDTLQDLNLDPNQIDPRVAVADEIEYSPEHKALSGEQVGQLNQVRGHLSRMLGNPEYSQEALVVVDCMFGLGLTPTSKTGLEMTMRECCDVLNLPGETQARKIARCQVLLDKGLDLIREMIRSDMPGIAQAWQADININSASRRELNHQLGLTEGEVDRLIKNRQYYSMDELIDKKIVKAERIAEIQERGGVAAFIPVDLNQATRRDITDIVGLTKEQAKKVVDERPFASIEELLTRGIADKFMLARFVENGAVVGGGQRSLNKVDLNKAEQESLLSLGLSKEDCQRLVRARPFETWIEVERFLGLETAAKSGIGATLREKACLFSGSS